MSKSSIQILQGSQHSTTPKVYKPGQILVDSPKYHKECLIKPGENVWQAEERLGEEFPEELKIKTKTKGLKI